MNVMIVDDSATARMVIKRCFEIGVSTEAVIIEATNGVEALEKLKDAKIGLIITDLNMPNMSGQELLQNIKKSDHLNKIPVIVITSVANPKIEKSLVEDGVAAVLGKPISPMRMSDVILGLNIEGLDEV